MAKPAGGSPLVSFVVPTFNSGRDLLLTLGSIAGQNFRDFEIIISDDGSVPGYSEEIVDMMDLMPKDIRMRLIRSHENAGVVANLQKAYLKASGRYIKPLAPGDLLYEEDTLAKMLAFVETSPVPFVAGLQRSYRCDDLGVVHDVPDFLFPGPREWEISDCYTAFQVLLRRNFLSGPTFFFEKTFYLENCWIPDCVKYLEDYSAAILLAWRGYVPSICKRFWVFYQVGTGITTNGSKYWLEKTGEDHLRICEFLDSSLAPYPCDPRFRKMIRRYCSFERTRSNLPGMVRDKLKFLFDWAQYPGAFAAIPARKRFSSSRERRKAHSRLLESECDGFMEMIRAFYWKA